VRSIDDLNTMSVLLYSSSHHFKEGWPDPSIGFGKSRAQFVCAEVFYSILSPRSFPLLDFGIILDLLSWGLLYWDKYHSLDHYNHLVSAVYGCDPIRTHFENPN
jgi:hypothetical protein